MCTIVCKVSPPWNHHRLNISGMFKTINTSKSNYWDNMYTCAPGVCRFTVLYLITFTGNREEWMCKCPLVCGVQPLGHVLLTFFLVGRPLAPRKWSNVTSGSEQSKKINLFFFSQATGLKLTSFWQTAKEETFIKRRPVRCLTVVLKLATLTQLQDNNETNIWKCEALWYGLDWPQGHYLGRANKADSEGL